MNDQTKDIIDMTSTPELEDAIILATRVAFESIFGVESSHYTPHITDWDRIFAQTLINKLLEDMDATGCPAYRNGSRDAVKLIKRRAGIGVK